MDTGMVELAVRALADTYTEKAVGEPPSEEGLRALVKRATQALKGRVELAPHKIEAIFQAAMSRPSYAAGFEYSRRQVTRWFEVPLDEFDQTPMTSLNPEILFRHVYYEGQISRWFSEWGYDTQIGKELEGIEGADFVPDVYAELDTLHGSFQVAVSLSSARSPSTWRLLGMLQSIEPFAPKRSEFGQRDIYLLVTPFKFLEQASSHIRIEAREQDYEVVAVEGNDLQDLERAPDPQARRERLKELVESVDRGRNSGPHV